MAVIDIFRQKEIQAILNLLKEGEKTGAELNDRIVTIAALNISTATFYRRLKELIMANVIKKVGKVYRLTAFGIKLYEEFLTTAIHQEIISPKEQVILRQVKLHDSISKKEILSEMIGSNSDLLQKIHELEEAGYIQPIKSKKKRKSRGRPSPTYRLTKKGRKTIEEVDKLKDLATHDVEDDEDQPSEGDE